MPPAALHHDVNTFAASMNSESFVNPTSVKTPTWICDAVTPVAGALDGEPGPQTPFNEPKSPLAAAAVLDGSLVGVRLLHPAATRPVVRSTAMNIFRFTGVLPPQWSPGWDGCVFRGGAISGRSC